MKEEKQRQEAKVENEAFAPLPRSLFPTTINAATWLLTDSKPHFRAGFREDGGI